MSKQKPGSRLRNIVNLVLISSFAWNLPAQAQTLSQKFTGVWEGKITDDGLLYKTVSLALVSIFEDEVAGLFFDESLECVGKLLVEKVEQDYVELTVREYFTKSKYCPEGYKVELTKLSSGLTMINYYGSFKYGRASGKLYRISP